MRLGNCLIALLWLYAATAFAHSDEYFDARLAPHGGQVRMAGPYHFELMLENDGVLVYVTDHADVPIGTDGANALALIDSNKVKSQIKLEPAGGNTLRGKGEFIRDAGMRLKLTVTMPGAKAQTARFTPMKRSAPATKP